MVRNVNPDADSKIVSAPQHMAQTCLDSLDQQIEQALGSKPSAILLDLSQLQSVDSASLNWLLQTQTRLALKQIELPHPQPPLKPATMSSWLRASTVASTITTTPENAPEGAVSRG